MVVFLESLLVAGLLALPVQAQTDGWQLQPADAAHGPVLTFASDAPVSYRFECSTSDVIVTQTGVTKLLDLQTGKTIEDGPGAAITPGAAMMAVFGGKGSPDFKPAQAVKNPGTGWDLTIRLPKNDKQLKSVGKSEMMSLFTTGHTTAVMLDASDRGLWKEFMKRCQAG